jgi:hypothetical protein
MSRPRISRPKICAALIFIFIIAALAIDIDEAAAVTCESLVSLKLSDTTITAAQSIPAGTYTAAKPET